LSIFEEDNRCALIPDRRYDAEIRGDLSKGEYDRSKFTFDEQKDFISVRRAVSLEE